MSGRLPTWQLILFAAPAIPMEMMLKPITSFLPAIYAKHTTIDLATLGFILFLTRISDSISDQVIGYLSDVTKSRYGSRKPWIVAGAAISMVAAYILFTPTPSTGPVAFFFTIFFLYLGFTMLFIPHAAWGSELSRSYTERTRISGYVGFIGAMSTLIIFSIPLLPIFETTEITLEVLGVIAVIIVVLLPVTVGLKVAFVPRGTPIEAVRPSILETFRSIKGNKIFWHFLSFLLLGGLVLGMVAGLVYFYMDNYLGLASKVPHLFIANMLASVGAIPFWMRLAKWFGKHRAAAYGSIFNILVLLPALWLMQPGENAFSHMMLWMIGLGLTGASVGVVVPAILGDIVDYDILRTGVNRAGNYFAFFGLAQKSLVAVGSAISFFMLDAFGFDPKADALTAEAAFGLKFTISVMPGLLSLLVVFILWTFPLDERRHAIIRRRIESRARRQG